MSEPRLVRMVFGAFIAMFLGGGFFFFVNGFMSLHRPHTQANDWVAFLNGGLEALLMMGPWGGVLVALDILFEREPGLPPVLSTGTWRGCVTGLVAAVLMSCLLYAFLWSFLPLLPLPEGCHASTPVPCWAMVLLAGIGGLAKGGGGLGKDRG